MKVPIGELAFFAGLDRKLLRKLEDSTIACQYAKGEVIIREGEMGLGMYIVLSGRVEVTKNREGIEIHLAELGPRQFFAEMSLIDDKPRSATVSTLEDTECLLITRDSFTQLMNRNPQLAVHLARSLAERLRQMDERIDRTSKPAIVQPVTANGEAPAEAPPATTNGSSEPVGSAFGKAAIQEKLLSAFERLYMVKAFTRFSVAVLGCPVEGTAGNLVEQLRVGDVKALILPAGERSEVHIEAFDSGRFSLHVFTPELAAPARFGPLPIQPKDSFTLHLPSLALSSSIKGRRVFYERCQ